MDPSTKNLLPATPLKTHQSNPSKIFKTPKDENKNPNLRSPGLNQSKSPILNHVKKNPKPSSKTPAFSSPKNRIRERKFVVAKRNLKREKADPAKAVCSCKNRVGKKCLCLAYESLRASQDEFFKKRVEENGTENCVLETIGPNGNDPEELSEFGEMGCLNNKRGRDIGKVMSLVKAFERLKTGTPEDSKEERELGGDDKKGVKLEFQITALETQISSSSICPSDFLHRSSLDSSQGSFTFSSKGSCVEHRSRRNSAESSGTFGGRRWRKKQQQLKATRQQPFKLLTEERGKNKEEDFTKKLQDMMVEEQKQRIPIAQGLPWTTDEPENLVKPPVKEITRPVDLVLRSDVRAVDRAEFDQQLAEKEALIEQFRMERERQKKMAEEEEIRRLRKELIPKAQPMPYFDRPFIPRRSEKQPTIPRDPKFHLPYQKKIKSWNSENDFYSFGQ